MQTCFCRQIKYGAVTKCKALFCSQTTILGQIIIVAHAKHLAATAPRNCKLNMPSCANRCFNIWTIWLTFKSYNCFAFHALTLSVGHQEEHSACKHWVMKCWCGNLSSTRCRLFVYGPANATAIPKHHHLLPHVKSRLVLPFWYQFTQVVMEKRQLNRCCVVVVKSCKFKWKCKQHQE